MMRRLTHCVTFAAAAALLALGGCVERKMTIISDPPGAFVEVNDVAVGRTPVTIPFLWYGDYDIRLRLDREVGEGADRHLEQYYLHTHKVASAPAYEWIGVDLFAEILPVQLKDEKVWAFTIPKAENPTDQQLVARAKELEALQEKPTKLGPKPDKNVKR